MRTERSASTPLLASVISAALLALACAAPPVDQQATTPDTAPVAEEAAADDQRTITGGEAYHGLLPYRARDAKLALVQPSFVEADQAELVDGVSVVGVMADGAFRAYPLYIMKNHQVVNDRLGDVPIAASW